MTGGPIRVLVVDDSLTVRRAIGGVLRRSPEFELAGEAENGLQAFELCRSLRPDVVTMDMVMPEMDGLRATEQIMAFCPTPILVVSSSLNRGEVFQTYEALAAGAVDVLDKVTDNDCEDWEARLLATLRLVSRVRVITHPRGRLGGLGKPSDGIGSTLQPFEPRGGSHLLALGASTGGPGAVAEILRALPPGLAVPILLVLHIGEPFGDSLASWLDSQTSYQVRYPVEGERLSEADGVLMAPPSRHLVLRAGRLWLTDDPERHSCRPSVDVLFESLAREVGPRTCACLLTGMGVDGAAGLLALRAAGARTIAQDEPSSVVYGMPKEAVRLGAAQLVLPLSHIASALADAVHGR
ncbi:MAG: chemotaxis-specific protein-glutamate methyltransferase CheB [Vulcanimicrobiota bacterium]